jgi:hypothetical protein
MKLEPDATFSALRIRAYRLFTIGQLVSIGGAWMQTVAQAILVLDLTGSGTDLGYSVATRFAPMFLLGPWGGLVADRMDRRRLLYLTQSLSAVLAATFGLLLHLHSITMLGVYLLTLGIGTVNAFDLPARQSFIPELVPPQDLHNAVTLNSVTINLGRVVGSAAGGIVVALIGLAPSFDLNALSFVVVIVTLAMMRGDSIVAGGERSREPGQIRAGLRYVRATPDLLIPLLMTSIIGLLAWEFQITMPLLAQRTFHGDATTLGTMLAVMGVGAVVGGLLTASQKVAGRRSVTSSCCSSATAA